MVGWTALFLVVSWENVRCVRSTDGSHQGSLSGSFVVRFSEEQCWLLAWGSYILMVTCFGFGWVLYGKACLKRMYDVPFVERFSEERRVCCHGY
jgi:hypothetical protein